MGEGSVQTYQETGIVAQTVIQTGEYVAGRDILITENNYSLSDSRFSEINLEPYKPENYIAPRFFPEVVSILKLKKLVIVGGNYEFDKNSFIRHLSVLLTEETKVHRVREWVDPGKNYSLFSAIASEKEPTIFIFPQITPQDIKYNLDRFVTLANDHGHMLVMSTDLPLEAWKLSNNVAEAHWFETPSTNLFERETLVNILVAELESNKDLINLPYPTGKLTGESFLVDDLSIKNIATQLETIDRIKLFIRSITIEKRTISKAIILDVIQSVTKDKQDLIRQWFSTLNGKEKEVLIAMSIFDGLYDDQFFSAVDRLIEEAWKSRDTKLVGIDYQDLDALLNFFNFEEIDENLRLIRGRFSNQRLDFLKTIWFSNRRQILSTFPVLVGFIKDSVYRWHSSWDLFGTSERRTRLQQVVSQMLSDVGIIHFPIVENVFLELASNENIEVQEITANSFARWRKFGSDEQLFEVLDRWQTESWVREIIQDMVKSNSQTASASEPFIRSTIALTIGYAADYDKPNELSQKLVEIFIDIANDSNEFVRKRIRLFTLPRLASNHLIQLKSHLFDLVQFNDFVYPIALGIAHAYLDQPEQTEALINEWLNYCKENTNKRSTQFNITHRDKVLITVILALSEIEYVETYSLNSEKAYEIICKLQTEENHIPVRNWYHKFILRQIDIYASKISNRILQAVEYLSTNDWPKLIDHFVKIYIEQRRELPNGEAEVSFRNRALPVWIDGNRPKTEIEITMQNWLITDNITAQQIAMDTLYEFTNLLEINESEFIQKIKDKRKRDSETTTNTPIYAINEKIKSYQANFKTRTIGWFTLGQYGIDSKKIIGNLLPILIRKELHQPKNLNLIAQKFESGENSQLQDISNYLKNLPRFISNYSVSRVLAIAILILWLLAILSSR